MIILWPNFLSPHVFFAIKNLFFLFFGFNKLKKTSSIKLIHDVIMHFPRIFLHHLPLFFLYQRASDRSPKFKMLLLKEQFSSFIVLWSNTPMWLCVVENKNLRLTSWKWVLQHKVLVHHLKWAPHQKKHLLYKISHRMGKL